MKHLITEKLMKSIRFETSYANKRLEVLKDVNTERGKTDGPEYA
jgi:hypothetical protein